MKLPWSTFALVSWPVLDKEGVLVPLVPCLVASFGLSWLLATMAMRMYCGRTYWDTPGTDRMDITLGFTSTTTVRMISCGLLECCIKTRDGVLTCVHGNTTHFWPPSKPSRASCLAKLGKMCLRVAGHADCATCVWADFADLSTLQAYDNALDLTPLRLLHNLLVHDERICASTPAEDTAAL